MPRTRIRCMGASGTASKGSALPPLGSAWLASRGRLPPSPAEPAGDAGRLLAPGDAPAAAAAAAAAGEAGLPLEAMAGNARAVLKRWRVPLQGT